MHYVSVSEAVWWVSTLVCSLHLNQCPSLAAAVLKAENWALIRALRSARLGGFVTWSPSPPLAHATNHRLAIKFQPSYSYTCCTTARAQAKVDVCTTPAHARGRIVAVSGN